MLDSLQGFADLLRRAGLRISSDEVLDGLRAAKLLGIDDRQSLRHSLAAAWLKHREERDRFNNLFDLYFSGGRVLAEMAQSSPFLSYLQQLDLSEEQRATLMRLLAQEISEMTAAGKIALGTPVPEIASLVQLAGMASELEGIRTPLQVGFYSYRLLGKLGIDAGEASARAAAARLSAAIGLEDGDALSGLVSENLRQFRCAVRAHVEGQFRLYEPEYRAQLGQETLRDRSFAQLQRADLEAMRSEIRRLARLLKARTSLRRRRKQRGRLDVRRSLRASLATGGIPFHLRFRRRPRRKPRLVVLCDVSDSVGQVSRFMLQFAYLLQELFSGVYSFAFVAELADMTELFRDFEIEAAIDRALDGSAINVFSNSNYGQALGEFHERHLGLLNRRTTVLVIGDARNNYHPAKTHLLEDMRRHCCQLIWLNPEAPAAWGVGDSVMSEYEPHCDKVVIARNLASLEVVLDDLLASEAGRGTCRVRL